MTIQIYDTTLRDGTQRVGISLSCADKLRIARKLDELGVAFIEGGWPGSNPKDVEFFDGRSRCNWRTALIAAFGSTCRVHSLPEEDANIQALLQANTPVCTVVGKSWTLHVTEVLQTTLDNNLRIITESLAYLKSQGRRVIYDAEHFFDGYKADPAYALETLQSGRARRRRNPGAVRYQRRKHALGGHRNRPGSQICRWTAPWASTRITTANAPWPIRWRPCRQALSRCRERSMAMANAVAMPICARSSPISR